MSFTYERSYRGPLQAVVLDWAGTTLDHGCRAPAAVFVEVFRRQGVEITMPEARGPMGIYKKDHIRELTRLPAVAARWQQRHGRAPGESDVEAMFEAFTPLQLACLEDYADLIPGCLEAVAAYRTRGLKIGSTTGYSREMMDIVEPAAAKRGYAPDAVVCSTEVLAGRPAPWMALRALERLGVYPPLACVKIGDTVPDIEEGLNAGMWTIGLTLAGNEVGLSEAELAALPAAEQDRLEAKAAQRLARAGAHYIARSIADTPALLDAIEARLARGERP